MTKNALIMAVALLVYQTAFGVISSQPGAFTFNDIPFLAQAQSVTATNPRPPIPPIIFLPDDENSYPTNLLQNIEFVRVRALGNKVYLFDGMEVEEGWYSTNGVSYFTNSSALSTAYGINDIGLDTNKNFYVMVGNGGTIWSSSDGTDMNWIPRVPYTNAVQWNAIVCQNGLWIAGGFSGASDGIVARSINVTNWSFTLTQNIPIFDLSTSGTNTTAACGGRILNSSDGFATYTTTETPYQSNGAIVYAATWDGAEFGCIGQSETNGYQAVGNYTTWYDEPYPQTVHGVIMNPEGRSIAIGHSAAYGYTLMCAAYRDGLYGGGYASYQSAPDNSPAGLWNTPSVDESQRVSTLPSVSVTWFKDRFVVANSYYYY